MKISVIVPVYNGESFIRRCLDSLLAQTFNNIEILIINDGSTDSSKQIAEEYCGKYSNIVLINKENAGLPQARKTGVENATGEYIGFVDVDDWVEPDMFSHLYNACTESNADIGCCGFLWDYESKVLPSNPEDITNQTMSGSEALKRLHTRKSIFQYAWNKLYKQEVFENITFPTGNFIGEDYTIITQAFCNAGTVVWIPELLYHYIQSENSMSRGGYSENYVTAYNNYIRLCHQLTEKFPSQKEYFENYILTEIASFIVAMGKNNNYNYDMVSDAVSYARNHRKQYVKADYIDRKFKISINAICINYKILIYGYRLVARIQKGLSNGGN